MDSNVNTQGTDTSTSTSGKRGRKPRERHPEKMLPALEQAFDQLTSLRAEKEARIKEETDRINSEYAEREAELVVAQSEAAKAYDAEADSRYGRFSDGRVFEIRKSASQLAVNLIKM